MWNKKILPFLKSAVIITLITLVLAEIVLRAFEHFSPPLDKKQKRAIYADQLNSKGLLIYQKNLNLMMGVENRPIKFKTNSDGFSWYEFPKEKDSTKKRILFIGDSFTSGMWADSFELSFAGISDKILSKENYEILNLGVSGYGFADYERMIKSYALAFQADEVIICSFSGNDFRDTEKGVLTPEKIQEPNRHEEQLLAKQFLNKTALYRNYSRIGNLIKVNNLKKKNPIIDSLRAGDDLSFSRWSDTVFCQTNKQAIDSVLLKFRAIYDFCSKNGIKLRVAAIPYDHQVYCKNTRQGNWNFSYPQIYLSRECSRLGVPFLDLMVPLRATVQKEQQRIYCIWDAHFNNLGHKMAGEEISRWVLSTR